MIKETVNINEFWVKNDIFSKLIFTSDFLTLTESSWSYSYQRLLDVNKNWLLNQTWNINNATTKLTNMKLIIRSCFIWCQCFIPPNYTDNFIVKHCPIISSYNQNFISAAIIIKRNLVSVFRFVNRSFQCKLETFIFERK